MSDKIEKLKKLRIQIRKFNDTLAYYQTLFDADKEIDEWEFKQLNDLQAKIDSIRAKIDKEIKKLSSKEALENSYHSLKEEIRDQLSQEDDVIDSEMIDNMPIDVLRKTNRDGLKITLHSAFWSEKFMDWLSKNHAVSAEELVMEVMRINKKSYKDKASYLHAVQQYECKGSLVSVSKTAGDFEITGYTSAVEGIPIKFTLYYGVSGTITLKEIEWVPLEKEKKGMQQLTGIPGFAASFVMKYSGFGELTRALHNHMDGKDPWTGEKGSTWRLALNGITDLLTMGLGGPAKSLKSIKSLVKLPAVTNILVNVIQESSEKFFPEQLEEVGLTREALDILLSLSGDDKYIKCIEIVSNLAQAGLVSEELIKKHIEDNLKEEDIELNEK
jgi:hypothetical protein